MQVLNAAYRRRELTLDEAIRAKEKAHLLALPNRAIARLGPGEFMRRLTRARGKATPISPQESSRLANAITEQMTRLKKG